MRWTIRDGWRRRVFRATALVTLVAWLSATGAAAEAEPPSNLDLLARMTSEIAGELYGRFAPELGARALQLRPFGGGEDYVFVGNVFADVLTSRGVITIAPPRAGAGGVGAGGAGASNPNPTAGAAAEPGATDDVVLTFQNIAFAVGYPDVYRSHLVGGKRVKRRADVRVHATLTDGRSGRVLWVGEAFREHADEFDFGDSARVEQGVYQFARPVLPGGGWGRYAEPVFVTGVIVGLIYLFFSNQSDN